MKVHEFEYTIAVDGLRYGYEGVDGISLAVNLHGHGGSRLRISRDNGKWDSVMFVDAADLLAALKAIVEWMEQQVEVKP